MVSLCSRNAFLMNFLFYIFLLLHWWLLFYGRPLKKKKSHIKTFSENATTLREAGYWFIPEALIRKTGSQHKVFPSLYSNEAEFALWCAALILETKEGGKNEIFRSNWPRQWCITELAGWVWKAVVRSQRQHSEGQGEHGEMERRSAVKASHSLPDGSLPHRRSIIRLVVAPGKLVAQWPRVSARFSIRTDKTFVLSLFDSAGIKRSEIRERGAIWKYKKIINCRLVFVKQIKKKKPTTATFRWQ